MMGCIYVSKSCPYDIDTVACSVGNICKTINDTGFYPLNLLLKHLNWHIRAVDGLAELGFIGSDAIEWLTVYEESEELSKIGKMRNINRKMLISSNLSNN
jgi:hypothetical protein